MPEPIFYFARLTLWDKVTILIYSVISAWVLLWVWAAIPEGSDPQSQRQVLFGYAFWTQFLLYQFNYKSLRNLTVYCFWIGMAVIHFCVYLNFGGNRLVDGFQGNPAAALRGTVVLLILFQILRVVSAKTQGQELVAPVRRDDVFGERPATFIDFVLYAIYLGVWMFLLMQARA